MGEPAAANAAAPPVYVKDEAYIQFVVPKRIAFFESIQNQQKLHRLALSPDLINRMVKVKEGIKWKTTPHDVAVAIAKRLAANALISKVNGDLWDMNRPLEADCKLELFTFDSDEGRRYTFWHSSAHILGESLKQVYGCRLCIRGLCSTREEDFYYDAFFW